MRDVELIIETVKNAFPIVNVRQLTVRHPGADDDGIWFFDQPDCEYEVQMESSSGMFPLLIETN